MQSLSVIIIVQNAAEQIRRCLQSVAAWVDEIIVLDSGSSDATVAICREFTAQVYCTDWPGYGQQKNRALERASGTWVFSIDADEWVSDALRDEMLACVAQPQDYDAFSLPRRNSYLGQWLYHGDVGRDRVVRLFRRGCARFSDSIVHETVVVPSKRIGQLTQPLYHESYRTLEDMLQRLNRYSSLSAQLRYQQGKKASFASGISHALWAFIKAYVLRRGFLDGRIGFIVAWYHAESSYYRHLKLWQLNNQSSTL